MNTEELREHCLSLPEAGEDQPWTEPQYQRLVDHLSRKKRDELGL